MYLEKKVFFGQQFIPDAFKLHLAAFLISFSAASQEMSKLDLFHMLKCSTPLLKIEQVLPENTKWLSANLTFNNFI